MDKDNENTNVPTPKEETKIEKKEESVVQSPEEGASIYAENSSSGTIESYKADPLPPHSPISSSVNLKGNPLLNSDEMLRSFIGPNYDKILRRPFNFGAFFFTFLYFFYRKMTLYGIIILIVQLVASYFLSNYAYLLIIINLVCTFSANRLYEHFAINKINKLLIDNTEKNLLEVKGMCYQAGGRSVFRIFTTFIWMILALIPVVIIVVIFGLSTTINNLMERLDINIELPDLPNIKVPDISFDNKFDGFIVVDKSYTALQYFTMSTPEEFVGTDLSNEYQLDFVYRSNNKSLGSCSFSFRAVNGYMSPKTLISQMRDYYKDYNPTEIEEKRISRINWLTFSYKNQESTVYHYACLRGKLVYLYTFVDQNDSSEKCHEYAKTLVGNIKFR